MRRPALSGVCRVLSPWRGSARRYCPWGRWRRRSEGMLIRGCFLKDHDFKFFEELLRKESGLVITPEKVYLLESRLLPIAQKNGVNALAGLAQKMRESRDAVLQREVVEAMTTNETSFFRDNTPFQRLR